MNPILVTNSDVNDPSNSAVKSGWKSTEAYITLIVSILGAIMASGFLDPADPTQATIVKVIGMILSVASVLGYGAGRAHVKATAIRGAADVAVARAQGVPGLDRDESR